MKCPICNEENAQDATTCENCGFGLALAEPNWPDAAMITFPEEIPVPAWNGAIEPVQNVEISHISVPAWPEWIEEEPVASVAPLAFPAEEPSISPPAVVEPAAEGDDSLARVHIERGLEALRERLFDQARWEFEQARHLAEDLEIAQMAEARLSELRAAIDQEVQERLSAAQRTPRASSRPSVSPPPVSRPVSAGPLNWTLVVRASLVFGLVAAILAAFSAGGCLGIFTTPLLALFAGMLAGGPRARLSVSSGAAGALVGLAGAVGGGVGQVATNVSDASDLPAAMAMFVFLVLFYSLLSAFAGLMGGVIVGLRKR